LLVVRNQSEAHRGHEWPRVSRCASAILAGGAGTVALRLVGGVSPRAGATSQGQRTSLAAGPPPCRAAPRVCRAPWYPRVWSSRRHRLDNRPTLSRPVRSGIRAARPILQSNRNGQRLSRSSWPHRRGRRPV